MVNKDLQ